ncbi:MAG TPA: aldo/keto reductase [Polyangiaceae bacterium]|nr:aldo/keto reductase [Polyangiaceae bacterium]
MLPVCAVFEETLAAPTLACRWPQTTRDGPSRPSLCDAPRKIRDTHRPPPGKLPWDSLNAFSTATVTLSGPVARPTRHALAAERGKTAAQLALAWVLAKQPAFVPVVGARTRKQLDDVLRALESPLCELAERTTEDVVF